MKCVRILSIVVLVMVAVPAVFAADLGVRAGRYSDADQDFIGVEGVFDLGTVNINPNLEYLLEGDVTAGSANLDITVDLINLPSVVPYLGAGLGLQYVDDDLASAQTEVVGNLIGGVQFSLAGLRPYAQVKYIRPIENDTEDSDVALTIGLRF